MITRIATPEINAEGTLEWFPYDTELVDDNGCCIHFWLGDRASPMRAERLRRKATWHREIVRSIPNAYL